MLNLAEDFLNTSHFVKVSVNSTLKIIKKSFPQISLDFEDCCKLEELRSSVKL